MHPLQQAESTSTKQATEQTTTLEAKAPLPPSEEAAPSKSKRKSRKKKPVASDDDIVVADTVIENMNVYVQEPEDVNEVVKKALKEKG